MEPDQQTYSIYTVGQRFGNRPESNALGEGETKYRIGVFVRFGNGDKASKGGANPPQGGAIPLFNPLQNKFENQKNIHLIAYNANPSTYKTESTGFLQTNAVCIGYLGKEVEEGGNKKVDLLFDGDVGDGLKNVKVTVGEGQTLKFYDNTVTQTEQDSKVAIVLGKKVPIDKDPEGEDPLNFTALFNNDNNINLDLGDLTPDQCGIRKLEGEELSKEQSKGKGKEIKVVKFESPTSTGESTPDLTTLNSSISSSGFDLDKFLNDNDDSLSQVLTPATPTGKKSIFRYPSQPIQMSVKLSRGELDDAGPDESRVSYTGSHNGHYSYCSFGDF